MSERQLIAEIRKDLGKNRAKVHRKEGRIPAVIYGQKKESVNLSVDRKAFLALLKTEKGQNIVFSLSYPAGEKSVEEQVIPYTLTQDPITQEVIHIDFIRVEASVPVKINVPIQLTGAAPGLKMGGILIQKADSLKISSLPEQIPNAVEVPLDELGVGDFIRIGDIKSESFTVLSNPADTIVRIAAPRTQIEEASPEGESSEEAETESGASSDA